ncbi:MAG: hypothetical protein WBP94_14930 [Rhodomicrobiaceae bacterium]
MLHNHPQDRDPSQFGGASTIITGGSHESYPVMPIIPASSVVRAFFRAPRFD